MILDKIVETKKQEVLKLEPHGEAPMNQINFLESLSKNEIGIIAEVKARSPLEGMLCEHFDPLAIAKAYEEGGADALSVLTDETYFGGSFEILSSIRKNTNLPILCKDFIIDSKQVYQARIAGANACLLIVSILSDQQLITLQELIESLGMTAMIEIFNERELERALAINPKLISINNRDLSNFAIYTDNAINLSAHIPESIRVVCASGISRPSEILALPKRIDAVLIGTALMRAKSPKTFLKSVRASER